MPGSNCYGRNAYLNRRFFQSAQTANLKHKTSVWITFCKVNNGDDRDKQCKKILTQEETKNKV